MLIVPTTAQPPLPVGAIDGLSEWQTDKTMVGACPYAWPWNVLGWPGVSVPAGFVDGLPVGAQLLGPANSEGLLLALAAELEEKLRWQERLRPIPSLNLPPRSTKPGGFLEPHRPRARRRRHRGPADRRLRRLRRVDVDCGT